MPRILIAECRQEVSSFNPVPSTASDFFFARGEEIVALHRGGALEVSGALDVFAQTGDVELVPTYSARARSSAGPLAAESWGRIADEFLAALAAAPAVDGVYFALHGAMAAANEPDPEGYLLQEARRILGEQVPIVISLDLHGVPTRRMLQHVNGLTAFHTYPHQDMYGTGARAATLLLKIVRGEAQPVMARVYIPALVRGDELKTATGLYGRSIRACQGIEASPGGLAAQVMIGNPFTDVPELGTNSIVIIDGDQARAEREALALAEAFWEVRAKLQWPLTSMAEAVRLAQETAGMIMLTDAADAPSSGSPGDSNAILRGLLEGGYTKRALLPIVDAPVVAAAVKAGIGGTLSMPIGGTLDPRYEPLPITATVRMLGDGHYRSEYSGTETEAGLTAVLQMGHITLVVTSQTVSLTDRSLFLAHGQNPHIFDAVVVKSPHCRQEYFDDFATLNISVDAPGSTSANLHSLGHTQCHRPIFPLDEGVVFEPVVEVFKR